MSKDNTPSNTDKDSKPKKKKIIDEKFTISRDPSIKDDTFIIGDDEEIDTVGGVADGQYVPATKPRTPREILEEFKAKSRFFSLLLLLVILLTAFFYLVSSMFFSDDKRGTAVKKGAPDTVVVPTQTKPISKNREDILKEENDSKEFVAGQLAPFFTLPTLNARNKSLASYRGKLVILMFWDNSCVTCSVTLDALNKLYAEFKDRGLVVVAVNNDPEANYQLVYEFTRNHKIRYVMLLDQFQRVSKLYKVKGSPETFVIAPDGKFIQITDPVWADDNIRITADYPWDSKMYKELIKNWLKHYNLFDADKSNILL